MNNELCIHGDGVKLVYDEPSGRAMLVRANGGVIVAHIAFAGNAAGSVTKKTASCGRLGSFEALSIARTHGVTDEILASPARPFILFRRTTANAGAEPLHIRSMPLVSLEATWAMDGRKLMTLGTGGLVAPEAKPGSYMWLALAEPGTRKGLVAGWITSDRGGGAVLSSREAGLARLTAHIDYGRLIIPPGKAEVSEVFALGWFEDARFGLEAWADAVAEVYDIHLPPQPVGYCSWNDGYQYVNEHQVAFRASQAAIHLKPFGFSVVQIDHGWHVGPPDWLQNPNGPFPGGMRAMSDRIQSLGLVPGLWACPFSGKGKEQLCSEPPSPSWFGAGLDLTNPEAIRHVQSVIRRLTDEYGYRYFKLDDFGSGLIDNGLDGQGWLSKHAFAYRPPNEPYWCKGQWRKVHDPLMTPYEAHRAGVKAIRAAAGTGAYILGCEPAQSMAIYGASFGVVDAMRIGMDNCFSVYPDDLEFACTSILDRKGNQWAHLLHGPIAGSRNYHLNRRIWHNDPDMVCDNLLLLSWVALSDSTWMVSGSFDFGYNLGQSPMADHFQKTIPNHGKPNRPVDLFETILPRVWIVSDGKGEGRRDVVGFFNWSAAGDKVAIEESLERLNMPADGLYVAYDFWADKLLGRFETNVKVEVPPKSCTILALRAWNKHPMVISTSRHVTQGMIDMAEERWDEAAQTLSGISRVVGGFPYELRIYAPAVFRADPGGKEVKASVLNEDGSPATVAAIVDGDMVRVPLKSATTREVRWSVCF
jgi:hypothetical protein